MCISNVILIYNIHFILVNSLGIAVTAHSILEKKYRLIKNRGSKKEFEAQITLPLNLVQFVIKYFFNVTV